SCGQGSPEKFIFNRPWSSINDLFRHLGTQGFKGGAGVSGRRREVSLFRRTCDVNYRMGPGSWGRTNGEIYGPWSDDLARGATRRLGHQPGPWSGQRGGSASAGGGGDRRATSAKGRKNQGDGLRRGQTQWRL